MSRAIPKWEPIEGDLGNTHGISCGGSRRRNQEDARRIGFGADLFRFAGDHGRRGFHHQSGGGGAGVAFTAKLVQAGDVAAPSSSIPEMPMPAPEKRGMHTAEETARVTAELLGIESSASPGGINGSHRRPAQRRTLFFSNSPI